MLAPQKVYDIPDFEDQFGVIAEILDRQTDAVEEDLDLLNGAGNVVDAAGEESDRVSIKSGHAKLLEVWLECDAGEVLLLVSG